MTLDELKLIRTILTKTVVDKKDADKARDIVNREIKLKEINPVTGEKHKEIKNGN